MGRGAERKIVQNAIFHGKRHDNKILKVKTLIVEKFYCHGAGSYLRKSTAISST